MVKLLVIALGLSACGKKDASTRDDMVGSTSAPAGEHARGDSKDKIAKLTVEKYADEAFPQWSMAHPDKACPDKLDDLDEYMNNSDIKDPWGNPYKLMCGQTLPPDAKHIAIMSLGPDGREGTDDDIRSWK